MDFGKGWIIGERIPEFARRKTENEYNGQKQVSTFINIGISRLREVDKNGNTHTIWCQEYDPQQKKSVGDKFYIGRIREIDVNRNATQPSSKIKPADELPKDWDSDLPF